MRDDFSVQGRRVVVVGAARSGVAAAELLVRRGARVMLSEHRATFDGADRLHAQGVELELGGHQAATFAAADLIVVSPGVALEQPALESARGRGVEVIGELELAWRWVKGRVIAITGTKGKSTTTTLVGRMLTAGGVDAVVGGNIGIPLSAQVERSTAATVHVVETSSFQLESTTTFHPWIAVWLNLTADHLDRHPSFDAYGDAKARVFANQTSDDWALVNAADPEVMRRVASIRSRVATFAGLREQTKPGSVCHSGPGHTEPGFLIAGDWIVRRTTSGDEPLVPVPAVELTGRHMLTNVVAASATASLAGIAPSAMVAALRGFHGLEHVMEPVGDVGGVRFVNDSKATNVAAARRSIESFDRGVVALIGGRFKGGDLRDLREPLSDRGRAVIAIGESAPMVAGALQGVVPVLVATSMRDAVAKGYEAAKPDGVVVLAPACASFDWFVDYAERGKAFKGEVEALRRREG